MTPTPVNEACVKSRNQLVTEHIWLVRYLRWKIFSQDLPSRIEDADFQQAGMLGLLDAAAKFDTKRDIKFKSYAEFRIIGEMREYLRNQDWAPRRLFDLRRKFEFRRREVEQRIGREASDAEVADEMGIPLDFYRAKILLLEGAKTGGDIDLVPVDLFSHFENDLDNDKKLVRVWNAVDKLPKKWKFVLNLYCREEMTYLEIGNQMGLDESRICQIHKAATERLRRWLR